MQLWQIRRKIHVSWHIALASIGVVVGTALTPTIDQVFFGSAVWLLIGLMLMGIIVWRRIMYLMPLIFIAGMLIGLWRGSLLSSQLTVYENIIGRHVTVRGTVSDDPDIGKRGSTVLRLTQVMINDHDVAGKIWISTNHTDELKRSDKVIIEGKLSAGFGSFSAAMFTAHLVGAERPRPGDIALRMRDGFGNKVRQSVSEPQSSLGLGYLVGQRRALPPELDEALVITGLTHVVVASGYNLTILVRFARRLFVRVSKYLAAFSASAMIAGFMAVTGASPSMSRAGLVAGLSLAAWYYGRRFHPLVLLPFAAAVTVLIDPTYTWNDLGWQLSFAAFAGVMILAPLMQRYFFGDKDPGTVRQILGETISATVLTLPILVLAFGQFSNVAILTNLIILPFVPFAMLLVFIAGIGVMIAPALAPIIGAPAQWLLSCMTSVVQYFAGLPWAQTIVEIQPWMLVLAYVSIAAICIYLWRATKYNLRDSNIVE